MQSFRPGAGHFARMLAAPPVDAEVCTDVSCKYHAHTKARSPAYEYALGLKVINPQCFVLPTAF